MNEDDILKAQVNALIRDEIQDVINNYVDDKEKNVKETGLGFVQNKDEEDLKVNISNAEVDKLIKEYKKIKRRQKSNLSQVKLLDRHGRQLK